MATVRLGDSVVPATAPASNKTMFYAISVVCLVGGWFAFGKHAMRANRRSLRKPRKRK